MKKYILLLLVLFLFTYQVKAQELDETLSNLSSTAGEAYVLPVISAFGSNLNTGWVSKPPAPARLDIGVDFKFIGMGSFFSDDNKVFSTSGTFNFTESQAEEIAENSGYTPGSPAYNNAVDEILSKEWNVNFDGPTIVGKKDEYLTVEFPGDASNNIDPYVLTVQEVNGYLEDLSVLPTAAAQLTVGTVAGTQASFRYFPSIDIQDLGKFSFWGAGVIHNPGFWMDQKLPVDLGVGVFYQKLEVGDVFETSAAQFGVYASKKFGTIASVTPYAGLTYETSSTSVSYTFEFDSPAGPQESKINFDLDGDNTVGLTLGATFSLVVVNFNIDYKVANVQTVSAGLSFGY